MPASAACLTSQPSSGVAKPTGGKDRIEQTLNAIVISSKSVLPNRQGFRASVSDKPRGAAPLQQEHKAPSIVVEAGPRKNQTDTAQDASVYPSTRKATASGKDVAQDETPRKKAADSSNVTTPGNSTVQDPTFSVVGITNAQAGPSKPRNTASSRPTVPLKKGKSKKEKEPLMLPPDYARWLKNKFDTGELKCSRNRFLEGKRIFFSNGDLQYATETTRKKMKLVSRSIRSFLLYRPLTPCG